MTISPMTAAPIAIPDAGEIGESGVKQDDAAADEEAAGEFDDEDAPTKPTPSRRARRRQAEAGVIG